MDPVWFRDANAFLCVCFELRADVYRIRFYLATSSAEGDRDSARRDSVGEPEPEPEDGLGRGGKERESLRIMCV